MHNLDAAPRFPAQLFPTGWSRLANGSLYHQTRTGLSYELAPLPSGGFVLLGLEISAVWQLQATDESSALAEIDQYVLS